MEGFQRHNESHDGEESVADMRAFIEEQKRGHGTEEPSRHKVEDDRIAMYFSKKAELEKNLAQAKKEMKGARENLRSTYQTIIDSIGQELRALKEEHGVKDEENSIEWRSAAGG